MEAEQEIKACPFCDSSDIVAKHFDNDGIGDWVAVECFGCGCRGPAQDTIAEAIQKWNEVKQFTLSQVKTAFWKTFHEEGEIWFPTTATDRESENVTQGWWEDFEEELEKAKGEIDG